MERPALQQLMEDIREHKIDVVVVYKASIGLTRSLADFARMLELFDANGFRSLPSPSSSIPRPRWDG